jgi:hypothetical protein
MGEGNPGSPGSGGASPYQRRGLPACTRLRAELWQNKLTLMRLRPNRGFPGCPGCDVGRREISAQAEPRPTQF